MFGDNVLDQKITTFKFFIAKVAFPDIFLSILRQLFIISDISLYLFANHPHIVLALIHFFCSFFSFFLNFLKDSLHVLQLFIVSLNSQKSWAYFQSKQSFIFETNSGVVVVSMNFSQINQENIHLCTIYSELFLKELVLFDTNLFVQGLDEFSQGVQILVDSRSRIVLEDFYSFWFCGGFAHNQRLIFNHETTQRKSCFVGMLFIVKLDPTVPDKIELLDRIRHGNRSVAFQFLHYSSNFISRDGSGHRFDENSIEVLVKSEVRCKMNLSLTWNMYFDSLVK